MLQTQQVWVLATATATVLAVLALASSSSRRRRRQCSSLAADARDTAGKAALRVEAFQPKDPDGGGGVLVTGSVQLQLRDLSELTFLTELDVGNCGLSELPEAIGCLTSLRRLNAAKNPLRDLPATLGQCRELTILFFLGCDFEEVPVVLGTLPVLYMLSFKGNKLRHVAETALAPSIGWLILSDNELRILPRSIGRLKGLRKCMLAGNQLESLPPELALGCRELELIRLADNKLLDLPLELLRLPRLAWVALAANDFNRQAAAEAMGQLETARGDLVVNEGPEGILGEGASGVVRSGKLGGEVVAVKYFRGGKTSDGNPVDEMAVTAVVGQLGAKGLLRCKGRAPKASAASERVLNIFSSPTSASSEQLEVDEEDGRVGLVLEFLDGWGALGNPPSFDSVTRDTYPASMTLSPQAVLGISLTVAQAAEAIHEAGIAHGDMYAHNILLPTRDLALKEAAPAVVLSDFGAAFFYKNKAADLSEEAKVLVERVEVLAFAHFLDELCQRCPSIQPWCETSPNKPSLNDGQGIQRTQGTWAATAASLRDLVGRCRAPDVASRPAFADINTALRALQCL